MEAGTLRLVLLLDNDTTVLLETALDKVTVHVDELPDTTVDGETCSDVNSAALTSDSVDVRDTPFNDAVTTAVLSAVNVPAVAVNVAPEAPAATITDAGAVRLVLLSDTATAVLATAAFDNPTVHMAEAPDPNEAGVHDSDVNSAALTSDSVAALLFPFSDAVTCPDVSAATAEMFAVKLAEL